MKKLYFIIIAMVLVGYTFSATQVIQSTNFDFTPSDVTITVGDTIEFLQVTGSHPVLEVSQATWDANGSTGNGGFSVPSGSGDVFAPFTTAGTYYYICTNHIGAGMKGKITVQAASGGSSDLIISGVFDGPLSGGTPKMVELYVVNDIADLSTFGIGSANNGDGSDGEEFTFPADAATAGSYIYISSEAPNFLAYFGFASDYTSGALAINGDDAMELFSGGSVIDVFGDIDCDPNASGTLCPDWEYLDGWAYRVDGTGPDGTTFALNNFTYSGAGVNNGETTNATATTPFPIGTFQLNSSPKVNLSTATATVNEGAGTVTIGNLLIDPAVTASSSVQLFIKSGSGDASDFSSPSFPISYTITAPTTSSAITLDLDDDVVFEDDETVQFVLRNATGDLTIGNDSLLLLTIIENDLPLDTVVRFTSAITLANEGDGTADLDVRIGQLSANGNTFTVDVALVSGDAADLNNYTTQTVTFGPGDSTIQTVSVTITDDTDIEGLEEFVFELINPSTGVDLGAIVFDTLRVSDNDLPQYSVATLTTVDTDGVVDSLGVAVEVTGTVVGVNFATLPDLDFFINDGTGGMSIFSDGNDFGYTLSEGDEITVQGTVGQDNGLIQLQNIDTVFLVGTGTLPMVTDVTSLGESTEGELVRLQNVTVIDQGDWGGSGAGFNVDVTNGTDTFSVRIDNNVDLFSAAIPGCVLNVTGIGSQFDNSSPFDEGYEILPRYTADMDVIEACETIITTIADIKENDPSGVSTLFGVDVTLTGVVTSTNFRPNGLLFHINDGTGGITLFSSAGNYGYTVNLGDEIQVEGNVGQFRGVTQIYLDTVEFLGAGIVPEPLTVTDLNESTEAELIRIEGLTLSSGSAWPADGSFENLTATDVAGNTYSIFVDDDTNVDGGTYPSHFNLVGIGSQNDDSSPYDSNYQIFPRFSTDITQSFVAINEISLDNFKLYPNPTKGTTAIIFNYSENESSVINVVDALGRVVIEQTENLLKGTNKVTLNIASLQAGIYMVQIETSKGVHTSTLVKE